MIRSFGCRCAWFPPLLARIVVGYVFVESGWGKLHNLPQVVSFFQELGIPFARAQAPFVAAIEFAGGLALILGFGTRIASAILTIVMVIALVTAKREALASFSDLSGTSEFLYIVIFVCLMGMGSGVIAISHFFRHKKVLDRLTQNP